MKKNRNILAESLAWLARQFSYTRELEAAHERCRKDFAELTENRCTIRDIAIRNGTLTAEFATEMAGLLAESYGKMLKKGGSENYCELTFRERGEPPDAAQIVVTVRWEHGKTPHQCRAEAEAEVARLRQRVSELEAGHRILQEGTEKTESIKYTIPDGLIPFNSTEALAGAEVVCRNGARPWKVFLDPHPCSPVYPLRVVIDGNEHVYCDDGRVYAEKEDDYDLFIRPGGVLIPTEGNQGNEGGAL